jgi:hypothetical protein
LRLFDRNLVACQLDAHVLARWADGSIQWALLDFLADHDGGPMPARYELHPGPAGAPAPGPAGLQLRSTADGVTVMTGTAQFEVRRQARFPFAAVGVDGVQAIDPDASGLFIEGAGGTPHACVVDRIEVERAGGVRADVRIEGAVALGTARLHVTATMTFHAGSATVTAALAVHNPGRARHPGGFWELGDAGSVLVRDVSLVLALHAGEPAAIRCSAERGEALAQVGAPLELFQASSGGERWQASTHVNQHGQVVLPFRGYALSAGGAMRSGLRATPVVSLDRGATRVIVAMQHFWQNFPKAIDADDRRISLRFFPARHPDLHEIQGGERKTHVFTMAFGEDAVTPIPLDWVRAPLVARAAPAHYAGTGAVAYLSPASELGDPEYAALVGAAIEGPDRLEARREVVDEYGWRNFGDLYADHEAVFDQGSEPLVSHYNNQYDVLGGFARQFMASGDCRWHALMTGLAAHVADIDIYQTAEDKAAYNGGLFWHTSHYKAAGRASHRSYPRVPGVWGGGPSNEHNYATGLMLHYFLTGDRSSRDAALSLARWVMAMDDGGRTVFRWLARGDTGLASATASSDYHGPGRGAGNSIAALLVGHQLTGEPVWLRKAEAIIRRCIHPDDDPAAFDLLNREARWSYTVFLCALGRYLDQTSESGAIDVMHAYARSSLLRFATWMLAHEYPYLDRPDELEFPTETWAAQEMWKSEALAFAARYETDGRMRERLLERATFFFQYATRTLSGMPTRALTRPMALLLSRGHMHRGLWPLTPAPERATVRFPPREAFEPQKVRALRRARIVGLVAAIGAVIGAVVAAVIALGF